MVSNGAFLRFWDDRRFWVIQCEESGATIFGELSILKTEERITGKNEM